MLFTCLSWLSILHHRTIGQVKFCVQLFTQSHMSCTSPQKFSDTLQPAELACSLKLQALIEITARYEGNFTAVQHITAVACNSCKKLVGLTSGSFRMFTPMAQVYRSERRSAFNLTSHAHLQIKMHKRRPFGSCCPECRLA